MIHLSRLLFLFLLNILFSNCLVYSPDGAKYIQNYIALNKSIQEEFRGSHIPSILFGNLNPKDEELLNQVNEKEFYISIDGRLKKDGWKIQRTHKSSLQSNFQSKTNFSKTTWNGEELYVVHRKQSAQMGDLKPSISFLGIAELSIKDPSSTHTQKFLCRAFTCLLEETNEKKILSYEFSSATKDEYPEFYKKFAPRFNKLTFHATVIPDGSRDSSLIVENINQKLLIQFPRKPVSHKAWTSPRRIDIILDFSIKAYGLHIKVDKLRYVLIHKKTKTSESLSGRFQGIPRSSIEGRFFYILPQGIVDIFIPGDIESYFTKGLTLATVGTTGNAGSRFTTYFSGTGKSARYRTDSYSESYRKKFSLFGSKREPPPEPKSGDSNQFFNDLWISIGKDLAQKTQ